MEVTREMQVHFFHWNNLCITTTSGPTLHTKVWPQRGFTDTHASVFTNVVQAINKAYRCCCFTFSCGCRIDCRYKDQFAVFFILNRVNQVLADFCFIVTIREQVTGFDAKFRSNFLDGAFLCLTGNFYVCFISHVAEPLLVIVYNGIL